MKKTYLLGLVVSAITVSTSLSAENLANMPIDVSVRAENWQPSLRYPDPLVEVLDESFLKYRLFSASVEMLATGFRWTEGPAWNRAGGYLVFSDIPNNRMMKWDEKSSATTAYNASVNNSNGIIYDQQGRMINVEHLNRRVIRTELDGTTTILADSYAGKPLNSPNDLAVSPVDGSVWFTDPIFGIVGYYEGEKGAQEQDVQGVYRIDAVTGDIKLVLKDLNAPNGLAFSKDGKQLFVVDVRSKPTRTILRYDVQADGTLLNKTVHFAADKDAALDGITVDEDGNIWAGYGSTGALGVDPASLDGVIVINPKGKIIGHIHTPERCANVTFGGRYNNRLFMACSHSLYSLYVNTRGAY